MKSKNRFGLFVCVCLMAVALGCAVTPYHLQLCDLYDPPPQHALHIQQEYTADIQQPPVRHADARPRPCIDDLKNDIPVIEPQREHLRRQKQSHPTSTHAKDYVANGEHPRTKLEAMQIRRASYSQRSRPAH